MDYFKPSFRYLGPLVLILQGFEYLHAGFLRDVSGYLSKMGALFTLNLENKILGTSFITKRILYGLF